MQPALVGRGRNRAGSAHERGDGGRGYRGEAGLLSAALEMDDLIEGTGAHYRAVALPFFMENRLRQTRSMSDEGVFALANTADRPLPNVATRDVAAAAAQLLLDDSWSGPARVPLVSGDNLTPDQMAEVVSETLGRHRRSPGELRVDRVGARAPVGRVEHGHGHGHGHGRHR